MVVMQNNNFSTDYTENPICPHCGNENYEIGIDLLQSDTMSDGDISFVKCESCRQGFSVVTNVEISFSTSADNPKTFNDDDDMEYEIEVVPYDGDDEE